MFELGEVRVWVAQFAKAWLGDVRLSLYMLGFIYYLKGPHNHILKVSVQYLNFWQSYKVCYNWGTSFMLDSGYMRLGWDRWGWVSWIFSGDHCDHIQKVSHQCYWFWSGFDLEIWHTGWESYVKNNYEVKDDPSPSCLQSGTINILQVTDDDGRNLVLV